MKTFITDIIPRLQQFSQKFVFLTLVMILFTTCKKTEHKYTILENYGGGIVFYIDETGQHGLIAAPTDQSTGTTWGCWITVIGTSTAIGTGQANTTAIVKGCSTDTIAAHICDDLVLNGYSDWFLPSLDELNQMYLQKVVTSNNISQMYYWSSSECKLSYNTSAWYQHLFTGQQTGAPKGCTYNVRAIRAF
jgi:hypothetical protein